MTQPGLERVIQIEFEHLDELGDLCRKKTDGGDHGKNTATLSSAGRDGTILDSIKHVSAQLSSVREVLPGRPLLYSHDRGEEKSPGGDGGGVPHCPHRLPLSPPQGPLPETYRLSPIMGTEICHLASIDGDVPASSLNDLEMTHLYHTFSLLMEDVKEGRFQPNIVYQDGNPVEFASLPLTCFEGGDYQAVAYDSISALLEDYYSARNRVNRIKQKSVDLRKIVQTLLERNYKKIRSPGETAEGYGKAGEIPDLRGSC